MSQLIQYILVIVVLLGAIGLFMAVSMRKGKKGTADDCEESSGCSTCLEDCTLKKEILEKSKEKHLQRPK